MSIISDCINTELPEVQNEKKARDEWLESKHLEEVDPLTDPDPNTYQIIQVGSAGLEMLEDSRKAMLRVQAFIKRHWPENKDMARTMKKALESAHKTEALFREALEGCQLTETDFIE